MLKKVVFFTAVIFCLCLPLVAQGQQVKEVKQVREVKGAVKAYRWSTGFVAWRTCDRLFTFSYSENTGTAAAPNWILYEAIPIGDNFYGNTGTISRKAVALGWSTSVWNLSTDIPTLK